MNQLIRLDFEIMKRAVWIQVLDTDKDAEFIKKKSEVALKILLDHYNSLPKLTPTDLIERHIDT